MVDWKQQLTRVADLKGSSRPKDGDIIDLSNVVNVEEREDSFVNDSGSTIKLIRFIYEMSDRDEIVVPLTLHEKIAKLKLEYGERLTKVKVSVEGKGKLTRYDALPLL